MKQEFEKKWTKIKDDFFSFSYSQKSSIETAINALKATGELGTVMRHHLKACFFFFLVKIVENKRTSNDEARIRKEMDKN